MSFVAEVPALGLAVYTLRHVQDGVDTRNHLASTTFLNAKASLQQSESVCVCVCECVCVCMCVSVSVCVCV